MRAIARARLSQPVRSSSSLSLRPGHQLDKFNEALNSFRLALLRKDATQVWSSYSDIARMGRLDNVGLRQYESLSTYLISDSSYLEHGRPTELAMSAAVHGSSTALCVLFKRMLQKGDLKDVIRLYGEFRSSVKIVEDLAPAFHLATPAPGQTVASPMTHSVKPGIRKGDTVELLLCAMAACLLTDSFNDAKEFYHATPFEIRTSTLTNFMQELFQNPHTTSSDDLTLRVSGFVDDLNVIQLVSKPAAFHKHMRNLEHDSNVASLYTLWQKIVAALHRRPPRLVIHSAVETDGQAKMPEEIWTTLISHFANSGRLDYTQEVWRTILILKMTPTPKMWNAFFQAFGKQGALREATAVWQNMRRLDISPTMKSYSSLISALTTRQQYEKASAVFAEVFNSFSGDRLLLLPFCNDEIRRRSEVGRTKEMMKLLQTMSRRGPQPSKETYNILLKHYQSTNDMPGVSTTMEDMFRNNITPDIASFTIALDAALKANNPAYTRNLLDLMSDFGLKPNTVMLTTLMSHLLRNGGRSNIEAARELLLSMEAQISEHTPNTITYTQLMKGIATCEEIPASEVEAAVEDLRLRMLRLNIKPNRVTFEILIRVALRNQNLPLAMEYFRQQQGKKMPFTSYAMELLLAAIASRQDNSEYAATVLHEIEQSGFVVSPTMARYMKTILKTISMRIYS